MSEIMSLFAAMLLKVGFVLFAANEIRGAILAGPVLYGIYQSGGTLVAIWMGVCSLGGIALSVLVPLVAARKFKRYSAARAAARAV